MVNVKYTEVQIEELLKNKYVHKCSNKNLTFTKECKLESTYLRQKELLSCKEVFRRLGFPEYIIQSRIPESSLNRWIKKLDKGKIDNKRGRKYKEKLDTYKMNKDEYIEYLEAKLALVEELQNLDKGKYP